MPDGQHPQRSPAADQYANIKETDEAAKHLRKLPPDAPAIRMEGVSHVQSLLYITSANRTAPRVCTANAVTNAATAQAWMRSRGASGVKTFTADDVVEQFGVVKGSYDAVPLPNIKAYTVRAGAPPAPMPHCTQRETSQAPGCLTCCKAGQTPRGHAAQCKPCRHCHAHCGDFGAAL